jgi:hypothetical protein
MYHRESYFPVATSGNKNLCRFEVLDCIFGGFHIVLNERRRKKSVALIMKRYNVVTALWMAVCAPTHSTAIDASGGLATENILADENEILDSSRPHTADTSFTHGNEGSSASFFVPQGEQGSHVFPSS